MAALALLVFGLSVSRRQWIQSGILVAGGGGPLLMTPDKANAAKGAAELDLEYYMRDLLGGNSKEGNVLPSLRPEVVPPRSLGDPLLSLLLNDECSSACLSTLALVQAVQQTTKRGDEKAIEGDIQERVNRYRSKVSKSFAARAQWRVEHVSDQYYFDLTSYALWRSAADLLPNYIDRDRFVRNLGRLIYEKSRVNGILRRPLPKKGSLVGTIASMTEILEAFKSSNFCKGYRIGEVNKEATIAVFDDLDDDALVGSASVDCLVSVFEPATLGASLQITGEQSRFAPDLVGATLAACWETAGIQSTWETFFVDPEYRPNPKDYFPNEQLLQYTLTLEQQSSVASK